jgi:carbamoyl-phosphate synthase small subunit
MKVDVAEQAAVLVLEDGAVFYGRPFGAVEALASGRCGEVVFATGMTGYQEICTDPSYRGQMVVLTYPLIGNYGVAADDGESWRPWLSALLVREHCDEYSNWRAADSLDRHLARHGIPGMCELDTRALTRHLRTHGSMRGVMQVYDAAQTLDLGALVERARSVRSVSELSAVADVGTTQLEVWRAEGSTVGAPRVLLIDTGFKRNIVRCLSERGMEVVIAPHGLGLGALDELHPDGVVLANGPGDPENVTTLIALTRALIRTRIPLFGICLGHQILGQAAGAHTSRLPFGHHGSNHPVREVRTGRVTVTAQNHTFQVDAGSLPRRSGFYVSHVNLCDGSVEGLAHEELPVFSVQFHPEGAPGPEDNRMLFGHFAALVAQWRATREQPAALAG